MKNLDLKIKNFAKSHAKYLISCDKIKNRDVVNLASLQRILQINAKTTLLNNTILCYSLKHSTVSISITHIPKNLLYNHYFDIKVNHLPELNLKICASNIKELMYKINYVYNLTKPKTNV